LNPLSATAPRAIRSIEHVVLDGRRAVASVEVPVLVHRSATLGPCAVITANLHGDETIGVAVAHRLDMWLQAHPFRGTIALYPSCNPTGLRAQTRHVPADDVDLNRLFPGNARGTSGSRLAASIWHDLSMRRPDLVVDLHADAPCAVPYVIVDRPVQSTGEARRKLGERLLALADATGLTVLREYPDEAYVQFGLDRSLAGAVVNVLHTPSVTLEVGPRRWMDSRSVAKALDATLGVLACGGLVDHVTHPDSTKVEGVWRRAPTPRARVAGLFDPRLEPGDRFSKGDVLAWLRTITGDVAESIIATDDGVLMSWVEASWVAPGALLGTLGIPDSERL
jgi:hypothetical protein